MSSIVYLKNKTNGTVYAYLNESEWDPVAKRCKCKRKCLGHVDPDTGEIVPNRGHGSKDITSVRSIGASTFLDHIATYIGLREALETSMPEKAPMLLSCVYYILAHGSEMSSMPYWSVENVTPYRKRITAEALMEMFGDITENDLFSFFRTWRDARSDRGFYGLHASSMSSFDSRSDLIRFNDLPNLDLDTRTHLYMVFGSDSRVPIAYGTYASPPKGLTDLRKRMNDMLWLDVPNPVHIMDRDYCSDENLDDLLRANQRFILRAPPDFPFARDAIVRVKDRIMDMKNMKNVDGSTVFGMSFVNYRNGKKCFAHIIFSAEEAEKEFSVFLSLIDQCYKELLTNVYVKDHQDFYRKYFVVRETEYGRTVEQDGEAIMRYNDVAGYMVLLSNTVKDPEAAYRNFLQKDRVQSYFENLRNRKDRSALKLYSDDVYQGRMFVQFLSTIMFSEIRRMMRSSVLLRNLPFDEIISEMAAIKKVSIPGFDTPFFTNLNNVQSRILKAFGISPNDLRQ